MKTIKIIQIFFCCLLLLVCAACNQDPIFYRISREVEPKTPRVEGTPTAMVIFERNLVKTMFVASGRLHWYVSPSVSEKPEWDLGNPIPQPKGNIHSIAATDKYLYVLSITDSSNNMTLQRIDKIGDAWVNIETSAKIQSIYACNNYLFAGSMDSSLNCAILYLEDGSSDISDLAGSGTALLSGAAFNGTDYYLTTCEQANRDKGGIYYADLGASSPAAKPLTNNTDPDAVSERAFTGIIGNGSQIIAVDRIGYVFNVEQSGFTQLLKLDKYTTGALALYEHSDGGNILLVGVRYSLTSTTTSAYTNGYLEIDLVSGEVTKDSPVHEPGKSESDTSLTTVGDRDRYAANLGKYPVNHLFQTPAGIDTNRTLFASTQNKGLWSYRPRDGVDQWNAEE